MAPRKIDPALVDHARKAMEKFLRRKSADDSSVSTTADIAFSVSSMPLGACADAPMGDTQLDTFDAGMSETQRSPDFFSLNDDEKFDALCKGMEDAEKLATPTEAATEAVETGSAEAKAASGKQAKKRARVTFKETHEVAETPAANRWATVAEDPAAADDEMKPKKPHIMMALGVTEDAAAHKPKQTAGDHAGQHATIAKVRSAPQMHETAASVITLLETAAKHPICGRCGRECDPLKSQLKSKCSGSFVCNVCNCRQVQIHKRFGAIPPELKSLDDEAQKKFWAEVGKAGNIEQITQSIVESLTARRVDRITASAHGSYLPLSVYRQQGFDCNDIESNCKDTRTHAVLGLTYRVAIDSVGRDSMFEHQREQVMTSLEKMRREKVTTASAKENTAQAEAAAGAKSSDESSSASDSDSSSSQKKKKSKKNKKDKNDKKNKKDKKEKEKKNKKDDAKDKESEKAAKAAAAKATKDKEKEKRSIDTFAKKVVAKVQPTIVQLETALKDKFIVKVVGFAVDAAKESLHKLQDMRKEGEARIKSPTDCRLIPWTQDEINKEEKDGAKAYQVLQSMLNAASDRFKKA